MSSLSSSIIQTQIKLIALKAARFSVVTEELPNTDTDLSAPLDFKLSMRDLRIDNKPNCFVKVFEVKLEGRIASEYVKIELEYHSVFECDRNIDDQFLNSDFARISAPAIGFPFVRSFVSTVTLQAGISTILLPSINFVQWSKENPPLVNDAQVEPAAIKPR